LIGVSLNEIVESFEEDKVSLFFNKSIFFKKNQKEKKRK